MERTKSGSDRLIPINPVLQGVFASLKEGDPKALNVFGNPTTGKPLTCLKHSFTTACRRAKIVGLRFHDLRHTFASRLVESGVDIITIKDLLGHSSVTITERYTHPNRGLKKVAVDLLAQESDAPVEGSKEPAPDRHAEEEPKANKPVTCLFSDN